MPPTELPQPDPDADTLESIEQQRDAAIETLARAWEEDLEDANDVYDVLTDEPGEVYEIQLDVHEFEIAQLLGGLHLGIAQEQRADGVIYQSAMLAKLYDALPESFAERMHEDEDVDPGVY